MTVLWRINKSVKSACPVGRHDRIRDDKKNDERSESNQINLNDNYSKSNQQTNQLNLITKHTYHHIIKIKKRIIIGLNGLNGLPFNTNNHSLAIRKALNPTIKIPLMSKVYPVGRFIL